MNERLEVIINKCNMVDNKRLGRISEYCMIKNKETIKNLKSENARLLKENKRLYAIIDKLEDRIDRLTDKNKNNPSYLRKTKEYKEFRKEVLKRDNYRCVKCGETENLQVHHIKPVKDYPNLVMNFDNVQTLCLLCHSKTESYLKK